MLADLNNNIPNQNITPHQLIEQGAGEPTREQLKTYRLVIETFQNLFKAMGLTSMGNFIGHIRQGVLWSYHQNGVKSGDLQKTLEKDITEMVHSPYDFSRFLNACRDMAELVSIPLGIALKNDAFSKVMTPLLMDEYKNLIEKSFYLKIPEKNANLQALFEKKLHPGASSNEQKKLLTEKVNASLEVAGILSMKFNLQEISLCLALVSSLAKVYALYLEKTNTPPNELLSILKIQSALTLQMHLKAIPEVFAKSTYAQHADPEDRNEILQEIQNEIAGEINLNASADNDGIYHDLLDYKNRMNQYAFVYGIDMGDFHKEMDILINSCSPLIAHRENMENEGTKLLQDHGTFLGEQKEKLLRVFNEFQTKLNEKDLSQFIKPEFEMALSTLEEQIQKNNLKLNELKINKVFGITPFSVLSLEEQKTMFDGIVKSTTTEKKQETIAFVRNICREI